MAASIQDSRKDIGEEDVLSRIYHDSVAACRSETYSVKELPSDLFPDAYNAKSQIHAKGDGDNFEKTFPALLLKEQTAPLESPSSNLTIIDSVTIGKEDSPRRELPPRQARPKEGTCHDDWLRQHLSSTYHGKEPWRAFELFTEDTLCKAFPEAQIIPQATTVPGIRPDFVVKFKNETIVIDSKYNSSSYIRKRSDVEKLISDMGFYDATTGILVVRDVRLVSKDVQCYCDNNGVVVLEANRSLGGNLRKVMECPPASAPVMKPKKKDVKSGMESNEGHERGDSEARGARRKDGKTDVNEKGDYASKAPGALKKDGTPDMRFKANRDGAGKKLEDLPELKNSNSETLALLKNANSEALGPLKKDGTPDMRFKLNHSSRDFDAPNLGPLKDGKPLKPTTIIPDKVPSISDACTGSLKKDGTPDMRCKANKEKYSTSLPSLPITSCPGSFLKQAEVIPEKVPISDSNANPLKKDGNPEMRYKANQQQYSTSSKPLKQEKSFDSDVCTGPLKKDGTPDMRYKANYDQYYSASSCPSMSSSPKFSSTPLKQTAVIPGMVTPNSGTGPLKKDGTPDMRYRANQELYSMSSLPSTTSSIEYSYSPSWPTAVIPEKTSSFSSAGTGPLKRDGTPDMRYSANREQFSMISHVPSRAASTGFSGSSNYSYNGNTSGPVTKSGLPDMRYSSNRRY